MNKVTIVAQMTIMHGLSNMNFHLPRLPLPQLLLSARSAQSTHQHSPPDIAPLPQINSQQSSGRQTTLDHFFHGKDTTLSLLEQILTSASEFAFSAWDASANTTKMSNLSSWYSTEYCFWSRNSLHSREVLQWSWNPLISPCSPPSWRSWPEWIPKETVIAPKGGRHQAVAVLQKAVYDFNQCPEYYIFSPLARLHVFQQSRGKGIIPLTITLVTH